MAEIAFARQRGKCKWALMGESSGMVVEKSSFKDREPLGPKAD